MTKLIVAFRNFAKASEAVYIEHTYSERFILNHNKFNSNYLPSYIYWKLSLNFPSQSLVLVASTRIKYVIFALRSLFVLMYGNAL
jgi:hypothetical protein